MREEDALFTCTRRGWQMQIVPRNAAGWRALALWLVPPVPITAAFGWVVESDHAPAHVAVYVLLYLAALGGWAFAMIRWCMSRSVMANPAARSANATRDADGRTYWFAPKRYGYGSGLPIAWQGWAVLAAYVAVLALTGWLDRMENGTARSAALGLFIAATATLLSVCHGRTRGGWKWRWGSDE